MLCMRTNKTHTNIPGLTVLIVINTQCHQLIRKYVYYLGPKPRIFPHSDLFYYKIPPSPNSALQLAVVIVRTRACMNSSPPKHHLTCTKHTHVITPPHPPTPHTPHTHACTHFILLYPPPVMGRLWSPINVAYRLGGSLIRAPDYEESELSALLLMYAEEEPASRREL